MLTQGIAPAFRCGVHLFILPSAIASIPSLSGHAIAYPWLSLPRVHRLGTSRPQGSCRNGCCLFRCHHGPIKVRLSFPTPTIIIIGSWYVVEVDMLCAIQSPASPFILLSPRLNMVLTHSRTPLSLTTPSITYY